MKEKPTEKNTKHPMQPVVIDKSGVHRFKSNPIVRHLLDTHPTLGLNELAVMGFSEDDWTQFAQLIGYSVSGAGDLSYMCKKIIRKADRASRKIAEGSGE